MANSVEKLGVCVRIGSTARFDLRSLENRRSHMREGVSTPENIAQGRDGEFFNRIGREPSTALRTRTVPANQKEMIENVQKKFPFMGSINLAKL